MMLTDYLILIIESVNSKVQIDFPISNYRQKLVHIIVTTNIKMMQSQQHTQASPQQHKQHKEKRVGNYILQKTLGEGTFGKVKMGHHVLTGEKVAVKILLKEKIVDVADVQRVSRQIHILNIVRHPNIIQLYEIIQTPKQLFLVMEYVENGELFDYIVKKRKMQEDQACKVFEQIISGIEYIHKLHIVHRDLKLQNILIEHDMSIRLVDFGLSNTYKASERLKTACGSPCYAAPEMVESKTPYEPLMVDIWSSGVILYAMVCGCLPFQDQDTGKLYKKILAGQYKKPKHISSELRDFLQKILTVDPQKRIRIDQMKKHKWLKKYANNAPDHYYSEGLIVGYHKMPIDQNILKDLRKFNLDIDACEKSLEANRHNNLTTTYYLLLKKFLKEGGVSAADFSGKYFDKLAIQPNKRKEKDNAIKASDLIRKSSSADKKPRSYYLGGYGQQKNNSQKHIESHSMNHSVKYNNKRKSIQKSFKKKAPKQRENKSFSRETREQISYNPASSENRITKRYKQLYGRSMSRSNSKKKKNSPRKNVSMVDDYYRPKGVNSNAKSKIRKSHQGSYLIGADTGIDWPLQPKYKGQTGGAKLRGVMRRK